MDLKGPTKAKKLTPNKSLLTQQGMLVVQKYGGSSLATPKHIQNAAKRIAELKRSGADIIVVASAMGHMTDHLLKLARKTVKSPSAREVDMLLTAGERISMSLLSMALLEEGIPAISFTGSQSGIITTNDHTEAKIIDIRPHRIQEELAKGKVVIIAGFQGVSEQKEITTLGRGGSDTTAVALAAILKADRCEILTDVEGLYSADPRLIPEAKILTALDYDEALEMASLGAKMQARSIEVARKFDVNLKILSSAQRESSGTQVGQKASQTGTRIEEAKITSIATKEGFHFFTVHAALAELSLLCDAHQSSLRFFNMSGESLSFLCETERAEALRGAFQHKSFDFTERANIAIVSVVGEGLGAATGILSKILGCAKNTASTCLLVSANSMSITIAVNSENKVKLAEILHAQLIVG